MALAHQYLTFRSTSNPDCLRDEVELHYVTSLTSHKQAPVVLKHLAAHAKLLKKTHEDVLSSIENSTRLAQEIETTIQFVEAGGSYLPGLDDNLIVDQEVTLPILHIVQFDNNGKIEQIRLHWDQATLLKGVGVIGARGSNWPIADGTHQAKLVRTSAGSAQDETIGAAAQQGGDPSFPSRTIKKVNPTNDPHTSLDLFAPRGLGDQVTPQKPIAAPRGTAKPHERPWDELFADGPSAEATPVAAVKEPTSQAGPGSVAPKIGAGKNYGPNRIFDDAQEAQISDKDRTYIKPNDKKFQHFDLSDGHDAPAPPPTQPRPRTKHQSQWDFSDFTTPAKPLRTRQQSQGAHHFSFEDDTKEDSPMKKPVHKPRRDAESHIELKDDGGDPDGAPMRQNRGANAQHHNRNESSLWASQTDDGGPDEVGAKSYVQTTAVSTKERHKTFDPHFQITDDAVIGDNEGTAEKPSRVFGVGANIKDRHKDFDAHWAIDDEAPGATDEAHDASRNRAGLSQNKAKVLHTLAPQWEARDDSPNPAEARILGGAGGKENHGIRTGGDGMGGRKGAARQWEFGDDGESAPDSPSKRPIGSSKGGRRPPGGQTSVAFWEGLEGN